MVVTHGSMQRQTTATSSWTAGRKEEVEEKEGGEVLL